MINRKTYNTRGNDMETTKQEMIESIEGFMGKMDGIENISYGAIEKLYKLINFLRVSERN
jgi:hypothetical protein